MGFSQYLGMRLFGTLMPIAIVLRGRPAFVFGRERSDTGPATAPPRSATVR
jgi:hypothetical protein